MDAGRLDELETFTVDDDTPDDARVSVPARDLRDLVALIPVVRAALGCEGACSEEWPNEKALLSALSDLKSKE